MGQVATWLGIPLTCRIETFRRKEQSNPALESPIINADYGQHLKQNGLRSWIRDSLVIHESTFNAILLTVVFF